MSEETIGTRLSWSEADFSLGAGTVQEIPPLAEHVVIAGAGFSGALLAINLLRHDGPRVTLVERRGAFAQGIAYSTEESRHLLNVRSSNMSALPDEPDHFVNWLQRQGAGAERGFASRLDYGRYLGELLEETVAGAEGRLQLLRGNAEALDFRDGSARLRLDGGAVVSADAAVLALGNLPPHDPSGLENADLAPGVYRADPWASDLADGLSDDDTVLVLGTGLTMVDVLLSLDAAGYRGRIVALSRRGLIPRAHAPQAGPYEPLQEKPAERGSELVNRLRRDAERIGWRGAIDAIRPFSQALWLGASEEERDRFLRHLRAWWDVHRHRLAPQVAARVAALQDEKRLHVIAAKLDDVRKAGDQAQVRFRPRHGELHEELRVSRIINCTGPQGNLMRSPEPLLQQLLGAGAIRPDRHSLGVDVNIKSEVLDRNGNPNPRLLALGPLTRGAFWEIASVPDIRVQAWSLARRLSASHWVEGEGL